MLHSSTIRALYLALLMELLAAHASAGDSCPRDRAEKYIRDSESAWAESVATNDPSVARRILADDFVGVAPSGAIYDKAHAADGPGGFKSNHLEYVNIRFFGDTAVAQGSEKWERNAVGARTGHFVWIDTWVCRKGQWQIVSAEDVMVVDKK